MAFVVEKNQPWSKIGLRVGIGSVIAVALLSVVDGILRGPMQLSAHDFTRAAMVVTWVSDFRFMFEQLMYVGAIVFIGGKFIETRTIFTVGFDKLDVNRVRLSGPDADNIVWVGHRYDSATEAATVADAMKARWAASDQP